jgi:ER membrane protein complex subunit 7
VYIVPKAEFSVVAMFKGNPMMLVMVGTAVLMFLMPKLLVRYVQSLYFPY